MDKEISQAVIRRMPRYYRYLGELIDAGVERISSNDLSSRMKVTASQIRQDLNNFGGFGQQGYGYNVKYLYEEIGKILGLNEKHNIIIVGAGPAGISAALYAARGNMDPLIINTGIGSLEKAEKIENYYGLEKPLSGKDLFERGLDQARALGVRILDAQVVGMGGFDTFEVKTTEGDFEARSVILATGSKRASAKIPGVKEFEGKGVSYCAVCDAFFYRGKEVAVLGNSDFALHEAEELSHTASHVTIFTDGKKPEFSRENSIDVNTMKIQAIEGDERVSGIRLKGDVNLQEAGEEVSSFEPAEGVFVALGTAGSSEMARQIGAELNEKGNIRVNEEMETTVPGLYAAGDCTGGLLQVAKAVHDGAQAGLSACQYVRKLLKSQA